MLEARGIRTSLENLIVTSGSQQGIDLIARVLVSPGDVVLVELPTFTGGIAAFKNAQAELVGVRQDASGIDLDDLDAVWQREHRAGKRIKLLYVIPNFQNPTGSLSGARSPRAAARVGRAPRSVDRRRRPLRLALLRGRRDASRRRVRFAPTMRTAGCCI